jgi:hypothetical protein
VEKGGKTGVIKQYRKNPQAFTRPSFEPSSPAMGRERNQKMNDEVQGLFFPRRAVDAILEDIKDILEKDDTIAPEAKKDLLSDLSTLKIQMERNVKNRQIIEVVSDNLSSIPSIAPLVTGLNCIVEGYFG